VISQHIAAGEHIEVFYYPTPRQMENIRAMVVAVIDDDERVLDALGNLLESVGYVTRLFSSPSAFLADSATLDTAACLITDVQVTGIDGFELQRMLAKRKPELPVILISGRFDSGDPRGFGPNNRGMFRKPVVSQVLLDALEKAISERN
jgi:FixJ family two-component response regulator